MLRAVALFSLLLCGSISASAQQCCCAEGSRYCEPRLKFTDDLFSLLHAPARRDPYEERMETERHDFTHSAKTVGCGVVQFEAGYTYFYHDQHEEIEQAHTTPEMLVRLGLSDDIEFRVRWTYAWAFADEGHNVDGAEDLRWGFKFATTEQEGWIPESALSVAFTASTGGEAFSTGRVEVGMNYVYGWEFAEIWSLYGSTGFATSALGDFGLIPEEPGSDHFIQWHQSVALGTEITERMTLYNEFYGLFSNALADEYSIVFYNMGVDYYVTDNLVLDFRAGVGLTPDSDDFFSGVGGGYRF